MLDGLFIAAMTGFFLAALAYVRAKNYSPGTEGDYAFRINYRINSERFAARLSGLCLAQTGKILSAF